MSSKVTNKLSQITEQIYNASALQAEERKQIGDAIYTAITLKSEEAIKKILVAPATNAAATPASSSTDNEERTETSATS